LADSSGIAQFQRSFQISPIILVGGIAGSLPGSSLPIYSLTESSIFPTGALSQADTSAQSDYDWFAFYEPMPGSTLIENEVATYPFANQTIAANAIITQPLRISLKMICPVRDSYAAKLTTFTAMQNALAQHIQLGGVFNVATPAYLYTNCLLVTLRDISGGETKQTQMEYQWDFMQPLLTQDQATQTYNGAMNKFSTGVALTGDPPATSGGPPNVGSTTSVAAPSVVPAAQPLVGASLSSATQPFSSSAFASGASAFNPILKLPGT
jgi:hypothetical protein